MAKPDESYRSVTGRHGRSRFIHHGPVPALISDDRRGTEAFSTFNKVLTMVQKRSNIGAGVSAGKGWARWRETRRAYPPPIDLPAEPAPRVTN
jgi:hypothetical protein